jgi:hypothetical protein
MVKKSSGLDKHPATALTIQKDEVELFHKFIMKIKEMSTHEGTLYVLGAEANRTLYFGTLTNHASIPMSNCHVCYKEPDGWIL